MTEYQKQYAEYLLRREFYNMQLGNSVLFPGWNGEAYPNDEPPCSVCHEYGHQCEEE